jgi:4-carboxymuconolactone decarboxylase
MSDSKIRRLLKACITGAMLTPWLAANPADGHKVTGGDALPDDVYPESGFRLPAPKREDMDDYGKQVFDELLSGKTGAITGIQGPIGVRLHDPHIAKLAHDLNHYLRFGTGIEASTRELAILVAAREMDSQFVWTAHEPAGLKAGLSEKTIDIIKYRKTSEGLPEEQAAVIELGRQMVGKKKVDPAVFARALKIFGNKKLLDLVSLISSYAATAMEFRAFDLHVRKDQKPLLPL